MNKTFKGLALGLLFGTGLSQYCIAVTALEAFQQQDYAQAKSLFQSEADSAEKNFYLGRIAEQTGDLDSAESYLEKAVEQANNEADYHYHFGMVNLKQAGNASIFSAPGYASDAKVEFEKALAIDPQHLLATKGLILYYSKVPSIIGGSTETALQYAEQLTDFAPESGLISQLDIYLEMEDQQRSLALANKLSEVFPNSAKALIKAGFAFQAYEEYDAALKAFQIASTTEGEHETKLNALYQLGKTAVLSGKNIDQGIAALERYLSADIPTGSPSANWAKFRLGDLYLQRGDKQMARQLAKAAAKDTDDRQLKTRAKRLLKKI